MRTLFPPPPGARFYGELVTDLRAHYGAMSRVAEPFGFWDGDELWDVPRGFMHDGASFPWWLRWLPAIVGVILLKFTDNLVSALALPVFLQAMVGWPLSSLVREAAVIHDHGYYEGDRPKWKCDRAFYRALWLRIWLNYQAGEINAVRAYLQRGRARLWTAIVFLFGFWAWWGHRRRKANS